MGSLFTTVLMGHAHGRQEVHPSWRPMQMVYLDG